MSTSVYSCQFKKEWREKKEYKDWIKEIPENPTKAYCKLCNKTIELSNMGQTGLTSHMKGKKHGQALALRSGAAPQQSMTVFCSSRDQPDSTLPDAGSSTSKQHHDECQAEDDGQERKDVDANGTCVRRNTNAVTHYATSREVKIAEIIWAMKSVMAHFSYNASADIGDVFRAMFPDSGIARNFKCASTKVAYLVCFGIAPYFKDKLIDNVRAAVCYVVSFDESLNSICQEGQMDINVRYFSGDKVVSQYLDSQCL